MTELIAIDWGTTNRRVFALSGDGTILAREADDRGVLAMAGHDFAAELAAIRARHGDAPVIMAGMVGSARGWREVPYVPCPADVGALARGAVAVAPRAWIVPGLADPAGDVMRGEEVQILGAVRDEALVCQPGTHCKWAHVRDGAITGFATAMTGEIFALLARHSLLAEAMAGAKGWATGDGPAFREGLADAADPAWLTRLFRVRAGWLLGQRAAEQGAAYVSGLLIGADVAGAGVGPGCEILLLADDRLGPLYAAAIGARGGTVRQMPSETAFLAGIRLIGSLIDAA